MKKEKIFEIRKESTLPIISPYSNILHFSKGDIVSIRFMNKKRSRFNFVDVSQILAIVVTMMIFFVGVFAFTTIWSSFEDNNLLDISDTKCATVSDPSIPQNVTIPEDATITRVYETLNTGATNTIDSNNYTRSGTIVTINVTG